MTDRESLLRAILADPAADLPRLVFADWLDEHGEPERAEFVRVQCRLADLDGGPRCPVCDWPYRSDGGCEPGNCSFRPDERSAEYERWKQKQTAYHALRHREREALAGPAFDWLDVEVGKPVWHSFAGPPVWSRGFVWKIKFSLPDFLAHAAILFASHPVTAVRLTDREPYQFTWNQSGDPVCMLLPGEKPDGWLWGGRGEGTPYDLPVGLLLGLPGKLHQRRRRDAPLRLYDTAAEAWAALVTHGRHLANLPALPATA